MKKYFILLASLAVFTAAAPYKPVTVRQNAQYLSTEIPTVADTCPGNDIFTPFTCTKQQAPGYSCFDIVQLQGDPIDKERYTLLDQTITTEPVSAEPLCPMSDLTCDNFLVALKYNLDFSWFIANFPSSSFPECGKTYSCTRIACFIAQPSASPDNPVSKKLSCVFKKNQTFFVGAEVTCQDKHQQAAK